MLIKKLSHRVVVFSLITVSMIAGQAWAGQTEPSVRMLYTVKDPDHRLVLADEKGVEVKTISGLTYSDLWSSDGERVLLELDEVEEYGEHVLAVMGLDLNLQPVKGQDPNLEIHGPVWSTDSKHVLLVEFKEVVSIGVDDTSSSGVYAQGGDVHISGVFPSPDGSKIAVEGYTMPYDPNRYDDVFVMNADYSNPVQLTTDGPRPSDIRWSQDGKQIAFVDQPAEVTDNKIIMMDADGQNRREFKEGYHYSVSWTDDGRLLTTWVDMATPQESRMCFLGTIDPSTGLATILRKGINMYFGSAEWRPRKV